MTIESGEKMKLIKLLGLLIIGILAIMVVGDLLFQSNSNKQSIAPNHVQVPTNDNWMQNTNPSVAAHKFTKIYNMSFDVEYMLPKEIVVNYGDNIKINIKSLTICDFYIQGYNIGQRMEENTLYELEFQATKPGMYRYTCSRAANPNVREGWLIVN